MILERQKTEIQISSIGQSHGVQEIFDNDNILITWIKNINKSHKVQVI